MANIREIKKRIASVRNTAKITRAMEMVAASRMRNAQERALRGRPYSEKLLKVMGDLAAQPGGAEAVCPLMEQRAAGDIAICPLLEQRPVNRIAIVHFTSDRGLCGGLNTNVNKLSDTYILEQNIPVSVVTVGKKGVDFMLQVGHEVRAEFSAMGDKPSFSDVMPIARVVMDDYIDGTIDQVFVAYPRFRSTAFQEPVFEQLLPVQPAELPAGSNVEYIYEPDPATVLDQLLPRYIEMKIYHVLLETIASEQSARMVAMRNATDAANEMVDELTLRYNKLRQEQITTELLDITAGAAAVRK
ncbi:MAG: ATP synthase F1 subunit gamma [Dehalococcoidia bacterium]